MKINPQFTALIGDNTKGKTSALDAIGNEEFFLELNLKIYLDTSVYNRPFDDQTQPRIWLETISVIDAMHIVFAEYSDCKYFITCDDKVIKKYNDTVISVISPLNFILNVIGGNNDTN